MRRLATFALLASLGLAAERRPPSPAAKPFVKLFAVYGPGKLEGFSDEQIKRVARNFGWINGHGGGWLRTAWPDGWQYFAGPSGGVDAQGRTIAERLRAENPEIIITNYRNGSYTSQNALPEAAEQERTLPLSIAVLDTGAHLTRPVASADRTIELHPPPGVPPGDAYKYPHNYPYHHVAQQYLPDTLVDRRYYLPTDQGYEATIGARMAAREAAREETRVRGRPQRQTIAGPKTDMKAAGSIMRTREDSRRKLAETEKRDAEGA